MKAGKIVAICSIGVFGAIVGTVVLQYAKKRAKSVNDILKEAEEEAHEKEDSSAEKENDILSNEKEKEEEMTHSNYKPFEYDQNCKFFEVDDLPADMTDCDVTVVSYYKDGIFAFEDTDEVIEDPERTFGDGFITDFLTIKKDSIILQSNKKLKSGIEEFYIIKKETKPFFDFDYSDYGFEKDDDEDYDIEEDDD